MTHKIGRTPPDEGSACRRDLYLTTHYIHKRQTVMPSTGFEAATPTNERPQTYALDHAATGIGCNETKIWKRLKGRKKTVFYFTE
jgi:hypothetical protein